MTVDTAIEILTERRACMECVMGNGSCEDCDHAFDMAIEKLEDSRWIPITERLPEEEGDYFTTQIDENGKEISRVAYYENEWFTRFEVTAWMPLPKPYEG